MSQVQLAVDSGQVPDGYKQTEVGVIPEEWNEVSLKSITTAIGDGIHSTPIYDSTGDYFFINGNNIDNGSINISNQTKRVSISEFEKHQKPLSDTSVLLSINGTIGNVGLYEQEPVILGKSAAYINVKSNVDRPYLYYILQSRKTQEQFDNGLTGTTIKNLGLSTIRETVVPWPCNTQERLSIAQALSDIDTLITSLEKLIAKKRAIKTATMQQLLTGKKRLPEFERHPNGELKGYKTTELGEIPEDWEIANLSQLGHFKNGINKGAESFGFGYPFVNLLDVFGVTAISSTASLGLLDSTALDRKEYKLDTGDVLFVRSSVKPSGVGLTTVVERDLKNTVFSGFLIRFRPTNALTNKFKKYCFHEERFRSSLIASSSVSANTNINQDSLKQLFIAFPSNIVEQDVISDVLIDMEKELSGLEDKLTKTQQLKQGMMQELLTGRTRLI